MRVKCASAVGGFNAALWPDQFAADPKIGDIVYQLPVVVGALNTQVSPTVTESTTHMTVSAINHKVGIFPTVQGYYWEPYVEVTLA
jgi:hypothetical protein